MIDMAGSKPPARRWVRVDPRLASAIAFVIGTWLLMLSVGWLHAEIQQVPAYGFLAVASVVVTLRLLVMLVTWRLDT